MRLRLLPGALVLLLGTMALSCSEKLTPPRLEQPTPAARASTAGLPPASQVVISQIYGAGGNSGAVLNRDYVELFNPGAAPVNVGGWKIHYASSAGTSWTNTTSIPSGTTIQSGQYLLIGGSSGSTGSALPTVDVAGSINLSGTTGKVILTSASVVLSSVKCPTDPSLVDEVSFGSGADDCGFGRAPSPSTTNAILRGDGGCTYTGVLGSDFAAAAPTPRNSASPLHVCSNGTPVGPLDHVTVSGKTTLLPDSTIQLSATGLDANNQTIAGLSFTWSSSDVTVATVDTSGNVRGVSASATPVTITATTTSGSITRSGTLPVTVQSPGIHWIEVSSSSTSFPPGFQTQLFATAYTADPAKGGTVVPATFSFASTDPAIVTVAPANNTGILTGVGPGTTGGITITALPLGGGLGYPFTWRKLTIEDPVTANPSIYATNDEFGDPTPADASSPNDLLIARPQYTLSYNESRGTPNWVSYELDARQMVVGQDRCNCFTADPLLPAAKQIFTSDYTGGGYDRGHMTRSADRTQANVDNARTFYLTNIVPQMADLNQGVWAKFENALGDSATRGGRAVYIITGPLYSRSHGLSFLKDSGKVAIPDSTWKIAFIGPRNGGVPFTRANVQSWSDLDGVTVLAVNMPNVNGIRNDPWSKYLTTVDQLEAATGYDFLSLLPTAFQDALEAGDHAPVPRFSVGGTPLEGAAVTFDASNSTDPDLGRSDLGRAEALSYSWAFSDGGTASGALATHTFADNGSYTATLTVTDAFGWQETTSQTLTVANVAPTVTLAATSPLTIFSGDHFAISGGFSDPGPDSPWKAVIDWGNGAASTSTWSAADATIADSAVFLPVGSYTVKLTVTDKDGGAGSAIVAVDVTRRPVPGAALPSAIDAAETDGDIMVTLSSAPLADISTLDPKSASIAGVGLSAGKKVKVKDNTRDGATVTLRFGRQDLIDAGLLTPSTTELVVTADLAGGVQIVSHVPVNVH